MVNQERIQIEKISAKIHDTWTSWAKNLLETEENISEERIKRWTEDCFKPYNELSESMKQLDRNFAVDILKLVKT